MVVSTATIFTRVKKEALMGAMSGRVYRGAEHGEGLSLGEDCRCCCC